MKKEKKVSFDMSQLGLTDLIKVYEDIVGFLSFLDEKRIPEEKGGEENE